MSAIKTTITVVTRAMQCAFGGIPRDDRLHRYEYLLADYASGAGKRMDVRAGTGSGTASDQFTDTSKQEENKYFISYLPWQEDAEHWWWMAIPDRGRPGWERRPQFR